MQGFNTTPNLDMVTIDQEGGMVNRFKWASQLQKLAPYVLGKNPNVSLTKEAGEITGELLRELGINVNLAPFLDLHDTLGTRGFSKDPAQISTYATAFMEGLLAAGVAPCAKHFPDSSDQQDTHHDIVRVNLSKEQLKIRERFQSLIAHGLPAIMMSHVIFDSVDPNNPASLSKIWITDILRNELNFKGLIVTDAMEMAAIQNLGIPEEEAIVRAFQAGADMVMPSGGDPRRVKKSITVGAEKLGLSADSTLVQGLLAGADLLTQSHVNPAEKALFDAYNQGRITEARINESARRILELDARFPRNKEAPNPQRLQVILSRAETLGNTLASTATTLPQNPTLLQQLQKSVWRINYPEGTPYRLLANFDSNNFASDPIVVKSGEKLGFPLQGTLGQGSLKIKLEVQTAPGRTRWLEYSLLSNQQAPGLSWDGKQLSITFDKDVSINKVELWGESDKLDLSVFGK